MRKRVFGVCDFDRDYAVLLAHYIGRREGYRFRVEAFSKPEALESFVLNEKLDVLLISESFIEAAEKTAVSDDAIPRDTYILTEDKEPGGYKFPEIYKYQSTEAIVCKVVNSLEVTPSAVKGFRKEASVIGVYSPVKRCGKTNLALNKAFESARNFNSVFVSLEDISAHREVQKEEGWLSLSDLLYKSAVGDDTVGIDKDIKKVGVLSILGSVGNPQDIRGVKQEDIVYAMDFLKKKNFQKIFVDVGDALQDVLSVLDLCDEIYMPHFDDEYSEAKVSLWEEWAREEGAYNVLEKTRKLLVQKE